MRKSVNPIFWLLLKRLWPECHNSLMIHFSKRIRATNGSFAEALFFCKHLQRFKSLQLHFGFSYMENKDILNLCTLVSSWEYGWFCSYSQDTVLEPQHLFSSLDWLCRVIEPARCPYGRNIGWVSVFGNVFEIYTCKRKSDTKIFQYRPNKLKYFL